MSATIVSGKDLAAELREEIKQKVAEMKQKQGAFSEKKIPRVKQGGRSAADRRPVWGAAEV